MRNIKKDYIFGGLLFVLTAAFFIIFAFDLGITKTVLGETSLGAGFFPFLLSVAVALCGIVLIIEGSRTRKGAQVSESAGLTREEIKKNARVAVLTILVLVAALLLWKLIGFYLMLAVMCLVMNYLFEEKLLPNIILTAGLVAFVYAAFTLGLKIRFQA